MTIEYAEEHIRYNYIYIHPTFTTDGIRRETPPRETSLGGVVVSGAWVLVGGVWLFVLHDSGEGPLLW